MNRDMYIVLIFNSWIFLTLTGEWLSHSLSLDNVHSIRNPGHFREEEEDWFTNVIRFTVKTLSGCFWSSKPSYGRTSDGGNGNHSVSLPIILIKIKVDQMLPSSY